MKAIRGYHRVRLIGALIVLAALALLCAVGIGIQLHGRAETIDSLAYWQAQLAAGDVRDPVGFESPAVRVRRLQAELDAVPERLLPLGVVFVLATGLGVLGWRALRRG